MNALFLTLSTNGLPFPSLAVSASLEVMATALVNGFAHVVHEGPDHVAFLIGLFFLCRKLETLAIQVTWFTLAHSLALGLAFFGFLQLPERAVEVAVALSIAFVAIECLTGAKLHRWRTFIVIGFGLIHGLAFAHTFHAGTLQPETWLLELFGFNVGVELGQLSVLAALTLCLRRFWYQPWYRKAIVNPVAFVLALLGCFLAFARFFQA